MTAHFLSIKKLNRGPGHLSVAARHNLREIQAEIGAGVHIAAARIGDNVVLCGPPIASEVVALADRLMAEAGAESVRRDAVRAVEIMFSLPAGSPIECASFFADAVDWVRGFFNVPVLSAVIHKDEAAPHCHVLLLPLVKGRMVGSDLVGNRTRLQGIQSSFFESVACRYGLARPKAAKRLNAALRHKAAELAYAAIVSDSNLLLRPPVESALLEAFGRNPEPILSAMNVPMPGPKRSFKRFVGIMTKPCKPEPGRHHVSNRIGVPDRRKPIGIVGNKEPREEPYVSVGFADSTGDHSAADCSVPPLASSPPAESMPESRSYSRCPDDLPSQLWDAELGEFRESGRAGKRSEIPP